MNVVKKLTTTALIILTVVGLFFVGKTAAVLGLSAYVNHAAEKDASPAQVYYVIQALSGDYMEPYKAYYNAGTAYAEHENWVGAQQFLETALNKVDYVYAECYIRNNLSITYQKSGDFYLESEMEDYAQQSYEKAVETVQNAPAECFPPSSGGGSGGSDSENPAKPSDVDEPPSDMKETGDQMKETEKTSEEKRDGLDGDEQEDGKGQVEDEMDQSKSETQAQEDQKQQEENQEQEQVEQPW